MAYEVVTAVIPGAVEPDEPETVQLDAPDGMFVTATYWSIGDDPRLAPPPFGGHPVIDPDGRVSGFVFTGAGSVEGVTSDLTVAIVCVS